MRRLLLTLALLVLSAVSALAQTTTFTTDINSNITVSGGGLTLTVSGSSNYKGARANVAKYGGAASCLWYFEWTPGSSTVTNESFGVSNGGAGTTINGAFSLSPGANIGANINSAGFITANNETYWNNAHTSAGGSAANGVTGAVVLNLCTDPPQIWTTNDITTLPCNGSGSSGTSNPKWNGTCADDPSLAGSGIPNNGTGHISVGPFLPGYAYYPTFIGYTSGEVVTFNFADDATLDALLPVGYHAWNTSGGGAPTPGPLSPMTINVCNAPGWAASTSYTTGSRVVAGPGWTPGSPGSYTSGSALYCWGLSGSGGTSSGSEPGGFASCASPANVGGGLNGVPPAGWSGATTVSDNGLTWYCLSKVDYVTLTGAFKDSSASWTTGTAYYVNQFVLNAGGSYRMSSTPGSPPYQCTSGASAPTGTTLGTAYSDGTCNWTYEGAITYSSRASQWPHQLFPLGATTLSETQTDYSVNINIWYGGTAQQTYLAGSNGEAIPILMTFHSDLFSDNTPDCYNGYTGTNVDYFFPYSYNAFNCNGVMNSFPWTLTAAPGDSFQDNITAATGPLWINSALGVTLENTAAWPAGGPNSKYATGGEPIAFSDTSGIVERLQFLSTQGMAVDGVYLNGPGNQHLNDIIFKNDIFDSGGGFGAITCDGTCDFQNDLIISRTAISGSFGIAQKYPGAIYHDTIIGNAATNGTCIQDYESGAGMYDGGTLFPPPFYDIQCYGFPNPWAYNGSYASTDGSNNATDVSSGFSGGSFTNSVSQTMTSVVLPGIGSTCTPPGNSSSCYSLTPSNELVNATIGTSFDGRIKSATADVYAGGGALSFSTGGSWHGTLVNGPDILGTSRPASGSRYDVGAEMFVPGANGGAGFMFGPFGANDNEPRVSRRAANDNLRRFLEACGTCGN